MKDAELKIMELTAKINKYGYVVVANPISGQEEAFANSLRADLEKIEKVASAIRKQYGLRGVSKNVVYILRKWMPEVSWSVEASA